jgi:hypothetical protein
MPFVANGGPLRPGEFYIPRLGHLDARFRERFDADIHVPKSLDMSAFEDLADYVHILVRVQAADEWTFERFAPTFAACIAMDLTGAKVGNSSLAPYNVRLDERLAHLARQERPLFGKTLVNTPDRPLTIHWLFIPMSNTGEIITHCLLMAACKGRQRHGYCQGTPDFAQLCEEVD